MPWITRLFLHVDIVLLGDFKCEMSETTMNLSDVHKMKITVLKHILKTQFSDSYLRGI